MRAEPPIDAPSPPFGSTGQEPTGPDEPLIPGGNALRPKSLIWVVAAALALAMLMASNRHFTLAVPFGTLAILVLSLALLDALGSFDDPERPRTSLPLKTLVRPLLEFGFALLMFVLAVRAAVGGALPWPAASAALLVTGSAWLSLIAGERLLRVSSSSTTRRIPVFGSMRRHGFWLMSLGLLLYLPRLGSFSLIDPWETHYGEVAREMLARDDWISLWWAQEGFFWSKPVLSFWLQGLAFSLFGVRFEPDQMLAGFAEGRVPAPEWAARLPGLCLALLATYLGYKAVARVFGRRAGFVSGLVLLTLPYWLFLSHQSMTDMPYVATLTAALSLVCIGLGIAPDARLDSLELVLGKRRWRVSAAHAVLGLVIATTVPQILYLLSRNVTLSLGEPGFGLKFHTDVFASGSGGGNCGLPGNDPCELFAPVNTLFQPAVSALVWAIVLGIFLFQNRGERRPQRLCFIAAWYFMALSILAKGAPGLVLVLVSALLAVAAAKRFRDFARLELVSLILVVGAVALPWYVQAFMRHGSGFTDRLLFYDMYKRAFVHVHDTNVGEDVSFRYYVWQLGYGLFPWTGLTVAGLLSWLAWGDESRKRRAEAGALFGLWFLLSFAMFSVSLTKFHHYVLPAVPPAAWLTGILVERMLGRGGNVSKQRSLFGWASFFASSVFGVCAALAFDAGAILARLSGSPADSEPSIVLGILFSIAAGMTFVAGFRQRHAAQNLPRAASNAFEIAIGSLFCGLAAFVTWLVGRDLFSSGSSEGPARLLNLFSYNYSRSWPSTLEFKPALHAFTSVFALLCLLSVIPRLRGASMRVSLCLATLFCAFLLNSYLIRIAPHWGQRETVSTYYLTRAGPEEPLVAYQMNWKGENFYTGNRLPAFITTGEKFKTWIQEQRQAGVRVLYFMSEHSRVASLKSELGSVKAFQLLTQKALNNKFFLARVEL